MLAVPPMLEPVQDPTPACRGDRQAGHRGGHDVSYRAPAARAGIRQEAYLGFSALGLVYLAGKGEEPAAAPAKRGSEAWAMAKDTKFALAQSCRLPTRFSDPDTIDLC
jgi:hypothetical protein